MQSMNWTELNEWLNENRSRILSPKECAEEIGPITDLIINERGVWVNRTFGTFPDEQLHGQLAESVKVHLSSLVCQRRDGCKNGVNYRISR